MSSATDSQPNLSSSFATLPSDSENYSASASPHSPDAPPSDSSTSSPLILYKPPTLWGLLRGAAINLLLPFVNGLMLGFGELVANEAAYRLGWSGTKVRLQVSFFLSFFSFVYWVARVKTTFESSMTEED